MLLSLASTNYTIQLTNKFKLKKNTAKGFPYKRSDWGHSCRGQRRLAGRNHNGDVLITLIMYTKEFKIVVDEVLCVC